MRTVAIITFTCLSALSLAGAQSEKDTNAQDRKALLQIKQAYEQAVQNRDPSILQPYLADGFSAVMVTGDTVEGIDDLKDYWQHIQDLIGENGTYQLQVSHEPALFRDEYALARGTTSDTVVAGGKTYQFESKWTAVLSHSESGWQIARLHASMNPIQNEFVSAVVAKASQVAGVIGFLAGALIAGGVTWFILRRSARSA